MPEEADPEARSELRGRVVFVLVMQCLVVLLCVGVTTAIAIGVQERSLRSATEERVLAVARSLAGLDQVRDALPLPREEATDLLQPLADLVTEASGVDYVVITDADGIRLTHPTPAERGQPVSTDPSDVLAGETFVGTETGTLGPTLRAKVPILDGTTVIGTASVGILESEIAADFTAAIGGLLPWVVGSVIVGCLVSALLTSLVRRRVRRLEGEARELLSQRRVAAALRDQTHEFHTRLHVVRGLVAEGDAAAALEYIAGLVPVTSASPRGHIADARARAILDAAVADLAARAGVLEIAEQSAVAPAVLGDDDLLVLSNLCRNATEAARSRVSVLLLADADRLHLEVGDDGPGIDAAQIGRIFDRGMSTKGTQRGIGLDLVRRAVGARGGAIEVGRSPWGGALFTVDVPIAAPAGRRS